MPRRSQKPSAEILAADRKARAVELRNRGYTFQQIADTLGYSHASAASKAFHSALAARPAQNVDQLRAEAATRYEHLLGEAVKQIEQPGPRVSAIGKIATFPDGHPRAGEIVEDESIRNRGIESARRVINDYVSLTGAALTPQGSGLDETCLRLYAEICAARGVQPAPLRPAAAVRLPAEIASRQADEALARHRAELAAATPQPGDDDIAEAEIVD